MTLARPDRAVMLLGLSAVAIGCVVIAGWVLGVSELTSVVSGETTMKVNAALAVIAAGVALILLREEGRDGRSLLAGRLLGLFVACVGLAVLFEYLIADLGIDELLFSDTGEYPGRLSPHVSLALLALGLTIALVDFRPARRLYEILVPTSVLIVFTALVGYSFQVDYLRTESGVTPVAIPALTALVVLSFGIALLRPDIGLVSYMRGEDQGASLARRLLPVAVLVPFVLGVIRYQLERQGVIELNVGVTIMVVASAAIFATGVMLTARQLSATDAERRRTDVARRQLAAIVESSDDAIIGRTLDGVIFSWNGGAERLYGYRAEEMIGQTLERLVPSDHAGEMPEILARIGRSEPVGQLETVRIRKDGARIDVSLSASPIRDEGGAIVGASTIARDVSDRVRAERRFSELLEAAPDAMVIVDESGKIVIANAQTERLFGYRREELIGERVEKLIPESVSQGHVEHRSGYFGDPHTRPMGAGLDLRARRSDGSGFPVEISLSPLAGESGTLVTAAVRDVTERQRAFEDLARSNEELEQFAYVASHDLQEPLRVIAGFVELLGRRYEGQLDADADRYIGLTVDGVVRMQELIDSLLGYSRVGRSEASLEPVDMQSLVAEVLDSLRTSLSERDVETCVGELPEVRGDRVLLTQMFTNLIGNAVKFNDSPEPQIEVSAERDNGEWIFTVADDGPGIDHRFNDRVFEMFKRLHPRSIPGTGVGLAICKRIAERHGGRIWVESEPGQGASFKFTIPERAALVPEQAPAALPATPPDVVPRTPVVPRPW